MTDSAAPTADRVSARLSPVTFRPCAGDCYRCDAGCVRCDGDCWTTERVAARLERMAAGYFG